MTVVRTPQGVKRDLEQEINKLMEDYETVHGLDIISARFRREPLHGSRRPNTTPKVNLTVQVPK